MKGSGIAKAKCSEVWQQRERKQCDDSLRRHAGNDIFRLQKDCMTKCSVEGKNKKTFRTVKNRQGGPLKIQITDV